jgi:hypothetical protein
MAVNGSYTPLKVNLLDEWSYLYNAVPYEYRVIDVPPMNFLMIDGAGDPDLDSGFKKSVEAIASLSYALKFAVRQQQHIDYAVMPLEVLWWGDDIRVSNYRMGAGSRWTVMIMQPDYVTPSLVSSVLSRIINQKKLPPLSKARIETYCEGVAVQGMHIGSYGANGPDIAELYRFIEAHDYERIGKYHEICLTNPADTPHDCLRMILRQPIRPKRRRR